MVIGSVNFIVLTSMMILLSVIWVRRSCVALVMLIVLVTLIIWMVMVMILVQLGWVSPIMSYIMLLTIMGWILLLIGAEI